MTAFVIQQEQKKFLNILEQNQILQKKLVLLLANKEKEAKSEANIKLHNKIPQHNSLEEISYIKGGLPKLENNSNPFNLNNANNANKTNNVNNANNVNLLIMATATGCNAAVP